MLTITFVAPPAQKENPYIYLNRGNRPDSYVLLIVNNGPSTITVYVQVVPQFGNDELVRGGIVPSSSMALQGVYGVRVCVDFDKKASQGTLTFMPASEVGSTLESSPALSTANSAPHRRRRAAPAR